MFCAEDGWYLLNEQLFNIFILIVSCVAPCIIYYTLCKLISAEITINFLLNFSTVTEFLFPHKYSTLSPIARSPTGSLP